MAPLNGLPILRWDRRNLLTLFTSLLVLWLCLSPLWALLDTTAAGETPGSYFKLDILYLYIKSFLLYSLVAILALAMGGTLAYLLARLKLSGRFVLLAILTVPLFVPGYIHAMSWSRMFMANGIVHNVFGSVLSTDAFTGWFATVWVLVLSYYPIALLAVTAGLLRWDRQRQESAQLYAGIGGAIKLELGYLKSYLILAGLLIFFMAFSNFGVPDFFLVHVYATEVFIQLSAYLNIKTAMLASLLPMLTGLLLLAWIARYITRIPVGMSGDTRSKAFYHPCPRAWKIAVSLVLYCVVGIAVILPMSNLLYMGADSALLMRAFRMIKGDLLSSLIISIITSVALTGTAVWLAYVYTRKISPAGYGLRVLILSLLIFPASLLALGLVQYWNQEGVFGWVYQSGAILILGLLLRWLPVLFELMVLGWAQLPTSQEEVALMCGVPWGKAFWQINIRQLAPGIVFIGLLGFILVFNELTMTIMLAPPGISTLPIRIFSTVHYGPDQLLAAICLLQVLVLIIPVGLIFWMSKTHFLQKGAL